MLTDGLWIIVMFLSDSHSDGTHSLQCIQVIFHSNSKLQKKVLNKKNTKNHKPEAFFACWMSFVLFLSQKEMVKRTYSVGVFYIQSELVWMERAV